MEGESTMVPVGIIWNGRLVIQRLFKDQISQEMDSSDPELHVVGQYQHAVTEVIRSLGGEDEVMRKYAEIATEWNEVGPPEDIKRRQIEYVRLEVLKHIFFAVLPQRSLVQLSTPF